MENSNMFYVIISYDKSDRMLFHGVYTTEDAVQNAIDFLEEDHEDDVEFDVYEVEPNKILMTGAELELVLGSSS